MFKVAPDIQLLTVEQLVAGVREKPQDEAAGCSDAACFVSDCFASDCFAELIRRFEPLLRGAWHRKAVSTEYPEYAQDVFLSLYRRLPQLRSAKAFPGYFRRIVLAVTADHVRRSMQLRAGTTVEIEDIVAQVDDSLFTAIFIRSYLEHLPIREKKVLAAQYLEGREISEIAKDMGLTNNAVNAIKARGITRLREMLYSDTKILEKTSEKF